MNLRVASPLDCGMGGGEYCAIWLGPELPGDQRGDDALSVCFDGAETKEAVDIVGAVARERWTIRPDDPLSAVGQTHWTQTLARDGWSIRTETFADMWSDATTFHLRGRIEAYEGGRKMFERDFKEAITRNLL